MGIDVNKAKLSLYKIIHALNKKKKSVDALNKQF